MNPQPMTMTINPFGDFLNVRLAELGLWQAEFCRRIGSPAGWVQQIREGKKTPPLDRMKNWADVLLLKGTDRQRFCDLAAVMHLPEVARPRFAALVEATYRRKAKEPELAPGPMPTIEGEMLMTRIVP